LCCCYCCFCHCLPYLLSWTIQFTFLHSLTI
jgi:hypothetical protein